MHATLAIAAKDLKLLLRDKGNFFFTFIFPVIFALFFGMIFRGGGGGEGGGGMDIALVDLDRGRASTQLATLLKEDAALNVHTPASLDEAKALVRTGKAAACVVIPEGFEAQARGVLSGSSMRLTTIVDPRRAAEAGLLQGKLNEKAFQVMASTLGDREALGESLAKARAEVQASTTLNPVQKLAFSGFFGAIETMQAQGVTPMGAQTPGTEQSGAGGWQPVVVELEELRKQQDNRPRSSFEISLGQGIVWGLMGCVTAFAASLVEERTRGTLMRICVGPVAPGGILLGKALACFVSCMLVQVLVLLAMMGAGVRLDRPGLLAVVFVVNAMGFTGIMMIIAGLSRSEGGASGVGRAVILVMAMIGGGTVPLFFLPGWVQTMASVSPFKWSTLAIEGATWRGMSIGELVLPCVIMLALACTGYVAGSLGLRRMVRM